MGGTEGLEHGLMRGLGLRGAVALNMINMIGVGPFVTLPLVALAMHGPPAIWAWLLGAALAACDGLVWAELGAAMPRAGGSYEYLRVIYGPKRLGRYLSFLYIWQLSFSAPLSIASGCVGLAQYAGYLFPALRAVYFRYDLPIPSPFGGAFHFAILLGPSTVAAMLCCATAAGLLFRNIESAGRLSGLLWVGVMAALAAAITAGLTHFHARQAFGMAGQFASGGAFWKGLGAATLIATYDYWGAYNINFLGGEVREPGRTIPRAILYSVGLVALLYLLLNTGVLGAMPWRQMSGGSGARLSVVAEMVGRVWGPTAGRVLAVLVMWTAFSSVYALLLGYSRAPYAAAADGNYFRIFARVHPRRRFPHISLLMLALAAMLFCVLQLADLVAALVTIRIVLQFLMQQVGLIVLRIRRPEMERPFKVWLYPLPPLAAIAGFLFILFSRPNFARELLIALAVLISGTAIYGVRAARRREWPFAERRRAG